MGRMKGSNLKGWILVSILFTGPLSLADEPKAVATIEVSAGDFGRIETPVSVVLDIPLPLNNVELVLKRGDQEIRSQLESGTTPLLVFLVSIPKGKTESYTLYLSETKSESPNRVNLESSENSVILVKNGQKLLQYNHGIWNPPEGVDKVYQRSGFIHPLWSPDGQVLTDVNPPDHYHHVGIWNPWTKTHFQGRSVDFWNLGERQGTVRFVGYKSRTEGPVFSGFKAIQEHVDFQAPQGEVVALTEEWDVRVWNQETPESSQAYLWELSTTLSCATDDEITMEEYGYGGGIGFRATPTWNKDNCEVLTSEGKTRIDGDGTSARWCITKGESAPGKTSGILFMSHVTNREHPEPMRIWPTDAADNQGLFFFEFCPIRHKTWTLKPGKEYTLKYRMLTFKEDLSAEQAERYWTDFAYPPGTSLVPIQK